MKQNWWILVIVLLVLAFGLIEIPIKPSGFLRPVVGKWIGGLTEEASPIPAIQPDMPTLTQDEVRALVYNYLEARASLVSPIGIRQPLLTALATARPYSTATYKGDGKWQISGLGYGLEDEDWVFNYGGLWNFYEVSRAIEPANGEASQLLLYIQRWAK